MLALLYFFINLWYSFSRNNRKKDQLLLFVILSMNFRFLCCRIFLKGVFFVICEINCRDIKTFVSFIHNVLPFEDKN